MLPIVVKQIIWENRRIGDTGNDCLISVDGADFRTPQHGKKFFSFKFRASGLRYEVALCVLTGEIVWVHGPFEPGMCNDLMIFQSALMSMLDPGERAEADDGCVGAAPLHIKCPKSVTNPEENEAMQQRVRA